VYGHPERLGGDVASGATDCPGQDNWQFVKADHALGGAGSEAPLCCRVGLPAKGASGRKTRKPPQMTTFGHVIGNVAAVLVIVLVAAIGARERPGYPEPQELRGIKGILTLGVLSYVWFFAWGVLLWWHIVLILLGWLVVEFVLGLVWMWRKI
jgi:hypothetical protein